jgi:hypothetical protein
MIAFVKRLREDRRGNVLAIVGAALPLLVGAAGLATDTIEWVLWKRQLQRAADSAALAGVYTRIANDDETAVEGAVDTDLTLNHHTGIGLRTGFPEVNLLADDGDMAERVEVVLEVQKALPFSSLFMTSPPTIRARAVAASVPGADEYCVVALETNPTRTGITIAGNTKIAMNCGFISLSPSANSSAINNGNASQVTASVMATVGGLQHSTNWNIEKYDPYVAPVDDPYKNINPTAGEMSGCAANPPAATENTVVPTGAATLCYSGITVGSNKTWDLGSNKTIYLTGRNANTPANVVLHGTLKCENCTIILTNKDMSTAAKIGTFDMQAQAQLDLSAQTTGTYRGIAVFQDRRATDTNGNNSPNKFNGGGSQVVEGALYFPSQEISYSGNGTATAVCTRFVTRRIVFTGNSATTNNFEKGSNCAGSGLDPIGGGTRVRLVG